MVALNFEKLANKLWKEAYNDGNNGLEGTICVNSSSNSEGGLEVFRKYDFGKYHCVDTCRFDREDRNEFVDGVGDAIEYLRYRVKDTLNVNVLKREGSFAVINVTRKLERKYSEEDHQRLANYFKTLRQDILRRIAQAYRVSLGSSIAEDERETTFYTSLRNQFLEDYTLAPRKITYKQARVAYELAFEGKYGGVDGNGKTISALPLASFADQTKPLEDKK
jgi:hypothetical protein